MLLILSNDVETNPGPQSADFERVLIEGLANLCRAAPTDSVRNVLSTWSPAKPGNEIRASWALGKRFLAPALKGTLAWLTNTRESDIKGTKHDVAGELLVALEALLPDTCQLCKEVYSTARDETPPLACKGCRQGFHQACYNRLQIGESFAELPGEFSWLCTHCAPHYTLKTVVGGRSGQERPRIRRGEPVVLQPPRVIPSDPDSVNVSEADTEETSGEQTATEQ